MKLRTLVLMAASMLALGTAHAAFTGSYAASQWVQTNTNGGNGSATISADGSSLTLVSSNFESFTDLIPSSLSYSLSFSEAVTLSFSWSYSSDDESGSSSDPFGYAINGVFYQLSTNDSYDAQSGTAVLTLNSGDLFSFVSSSTDSIFGSSTSTVTDFNAVTAAVPEPASLALSTAGLVCLVAVARRRTRRHG